MIVHLDASWAIQGIYCDNKTTLRTDTFSMLLTRATVICISRSSCREEINKCKKVKIFWCKQACAKIVYQSIWLILGACCLTVLSISCIYNLCLTPDLTKWMHLEQHQIRCGHWAQSHQIAMNWICEEVWVFHIDIYLPVCCEKPSDMKRNWYWESYKIITKS